MKIHALRADGRAVCGLEIPSERLVSLADAPAEARESVNCSSCLRLSGADSPSEVATQEQIRAIVREEISLGIEQLLRFGEVADVLAVSKKQVVKLVKKGFLSVVELPKKKVRIPVSSVESYIRSRTVKK